MNAKEIRMIIGIIGNLISFLISLSHIPAFIQIYKKKSVEGYEPHHHVGMLMKCCLWVLYGLPRVHKDGILITTSNGVGFLIEFICVVVFMIYCAKEKPPKWDEVKSPEWDGERSPQRDVISLCLLVEASTGTLLYGITLFFMPSFSTRHKLTGIVCNVYTFLMYFVLVTKTMMDNGRLSYMPFRLSLVCFINAGIWTAYSVIDKTDIYVLISYGVGTFFCACQLVIHACNYRKTYSKDEIETKFVSCC